MVPHLASLGAGGCVLAAVVIFTRAAARTHTSFLGAIKQINTESNAALGRLHVSLDANTIALVRLDARLSNSSHSASVTPNGTEEVT